MDPPKSLDSPVADYPLTETLEEAPKKSKTASFFNVVFSGFALLSDGYQSGCISFINLVLAQIYGTAVFNDTVSSRLSYSMFVGCVVGQLVSCTHVWWYRPIYRDITCLSFAFQRGSAFLWIA